MSAIHLYEVSVEEDLFVHAIEEVVEVREGCGVLVLKLCEEPPLHRTYLLAALHQLLLKGIKVLMAFNRGMPPVALHQLILKGYQGYGSNAFSKGMLLLLKDVKVKCRMYCIYM